MRKKYNIILLSILLQYALEHASSFLINPSNNAVFVESKTAQMKTTMTKTALYGIFQNVSSSIVIPKSIFCNDVIPKTSSVLISILLLGGYHVKLWQTERSGKLTWRSSQAKTREKWAKYVRETEQWLYAIQTLRNAITANTFLATTVLSLLTVISGKLWEMIRNLQKAGSGSNIVSYRILTVQFISIALCMLMSAYEFLQSARLMTHAGFMFPVNPQKTKVDAIMRKSQSSQWLGLRYLYVSISLICWTIGGEYGFLLSSLGLVRFFQQIDRVPMGLDSDDGHVII